MGKLKWWHWNLTNSQATHEAEGVTDAWEITQPNRKVQNQNVK